VIVVLRVIAAFFVLLAFGALGAGFEDQLGYWGQFAVVIAGMFAVSFVLPHYFYRGEPLFPDRRKRR
jgi:hypothetical protein